MGGWIYTGLKVAACMKGFTNSWAPNNFVMATSTSPSPKHPHRRPPTAVPKVAVADLRAHQALTSVVGAPTALLLLLMRRRGGAAVATRAVGHRARAAERGAQHGLGPRHLVVGKLRRELL